ncbi:MAG: SOS response-associated peptidase [Acholeplasmataceae bacterium]|nr:SOS response-associated peptidase [Acholeplasmataceae bacterium]
MCGRFTITVDLEDLREYLVEHFDISEMKSEFQLPRYNVAPSQDVITIINDGNKNRVGLLKWGFVPYFAKDEKIGNSMINAKSETLIDKPSFKSSFQLKRCVILADSFYEWKREENSKTPMRIGLSDEKLFPMAGLWSTFVKPDGTKLHTTTIITTKANELMSEIHDRMPVILDDVAVKEWLNPRNQDLLNLSNLLQPFPSEKMYAYPVNSVVNNAKNDSKECILKV